MKTILIIEDDEAFGTILSRQLTRKGYSTEVCQYPTEALLCLKTFQPDGIILDLNLNGESGLSLIPLLKKKAPTASILMLTGYASIPTAVEAMKLGAIHYLAKPARLEEILKALNVKQSDNPPDEALEETETIPEPMSLRRLRWEHIQRVLAENEGNVSATARVLNIHRRTLQRMLAKKPGA